MPATLAEQETSSKPFYESLEYLDFLDNYVSEYPDDFKSAADVPERMISYIKSEFLKTVLDGKWDGITKPEAWQIVRNYIEENEKLAEDESYEDRSWLVSSFNDLENALARSLASTKVKSKNVAGYVDAASFLMTRLSGHKIFNDGTKNLRAKLIDGHSELKSIAKGETAKKYAELLGNPDFYSKLGDLFNRVVTDDEDRVIELYIDHDRYDQRKELLTDILAQIGISDVDGIIEASKLTHNFSKVQGLDIEISYTLSKIAELEKERPGAAALLHNIYGIRGFARYPKHQLIEQYDSHGKADKSYGLYVTAVADHNGAFSHLKHGSGGVGRRVASHGFQLRVIEADSRLDLARRLLTLDKLYGQDQKISFMVVSAHGSRESISFGNTWFNRLGALSLGTKMRNSRRIFTKHPVILLESCSTGQEKGIAQRLSSDLGATVIGPPIDAGTADILVEVEDGKLKLEPDYKILEDDKNPFSPKVDIAPVLYIGGRKATPEQYDRYFKELIEERRIDTAEIEELRAAYKETN